MKLHNKKQLDCEKCSMRCSTLRRDLLHDNVSAASLAQSRSEAGPVGPDGLKNSNRTADYGDDTDEKKAGGQLLRRGQGSCSAVLCPIRGLQNILRPRWASDYHTDRPVSPGNGK